MHVHHPNKLILFQVQFIRRLHWYVMLPGNSPTSDKACALSSTVVDTRFPPQGLLLLYALTADNVAGAFWVIIRLNFIACYW